MTSVMMKWIFEKYKKNSPVLSSTEQESLEAGTVSWDAELFNGKPDWTKLFAFPAPVLSAEEKAFLDGPVEDLCQKINDWQITHIDADLPPEMWAFIKNKGFWGLIIPKQYGGKQFSAYAHSEILSKIYSVSATVGTTVNVPNSLGPAELLLNYGTEDQKNYYLPRLACGDEIPCFALTSPEAGSDASSITDSGTICYGEFEGKEILGIKLYWNKRYITLAPVATVLGLAFKLSDPDKLLSAQEERGITCALIPVKIPGITIGRRHFPLNAVFQNGPTQGDGVFIPLDWIIGGEKMIGQGWQMLMECLSAGRAISLPSSAVGASKTAVFGTGAYARIRKQFRLPIGKFEGVRERLARMAGELYAMDAARKLTLSIIDTGEKPSVLSAIMKYHATETARKIASDAMDIQGGKAICLGPRNYMGRLYESVPIGITVEGANILTRSLIIFGQGAIRCHRYVLAELKSAKENNLARFSTAFKGHVKLLLGNLARTFGLAFVPKSNQKKVDHYSAAFALVSDSLMIVLGSQLKRKEYLSGRLGDILRYLFVISSVLKQHEDHKKLGPLPEEDCLVQWVCETYFYKIQVSFNDILYNFPRYFLGRILSLLIFPLGKHCQKPHDDLTHKVSEILLSSNPMRDRLTKGMFTGNIMAVFQEALEKVDTPEGEALRQEVIAVDDFSTEELKH